MKFSIGLSKVAAMSALLATAMLTSTAFCQQQFDGDTSNPGDWNDPLNWTGDTLPTDAGNTITSVGTAVGGLGTATANISGMLTSDTIFDMHVGNGNGNSGTVNHSSGTLNVNNWSIVGLDANDAANGATGTYNLTGDAVLNSGNFHLGVGGGAGNGANSGFMTIADNANATFGAFVVGQNDANTGMVTQTGGSVQYNSWMTVGEALDATGTYDISGGSLTQNADWLTIGQQDGAEGNFNVSGTATVALNGNGAVLGRINTGGDLGSGRIELDGSSASFSTTNLFVGINDGFNGTLGDASGNGTLAFIADALGVSPIIASGDVRLNDGSILGGANLEIDLSALGTSGDILLVDVGGTLFGTFDGLAEGDSVGFGRRITYQFGDGNDIGLIAIPEPTAMTLLIAGSLGLATRRRRS